MRTYVLGRSRFADIVLADPSVAPRHAELSVTRDGRGYVVDAGAAGGSFQRLAEGGGWTALRQGFVGRGTILRFGAFEIPAQTLIELARGRPPGEPGRLWSGEGSEGSGGSGGAAGSGTGGDGRRPRGRVERDPVTGEIVGRPL